MCILASSIEVDTTSVFETLDFESIDDVGGWIETDVKYPTFKNRMLEYMTENCFEENKYIITKEVIHADENSDITTAEITVANSEGKCVIDIFLSI